MIDNTINGRTPEEIKRGLECCSVDGLSCSNCSYCVSCDADIHALERDALALIQQLEHNWDELFETAKQLERERDAAVAETESLKAEIDAINEDYLSGIHTVREDAQPKWISVTERMPEDDQCVIYSDDGEIAFRIVRGWALRELCEFPEHREVHRVTHWMPMPEPPK